jgi:hypothetical protein
MIIAANVIISSIAGMMLSDGPLVAGTRPVRSGRLVKDNVPNMAHAIEYNTAVCHDALKILLKFSV